MYPASMRTLGDLSKDGRSVEMLADTNGLNYRLVGDPSWIQLLTRAEIKGDAGPSNVITIGSVSTLTPGSPATASLTGTSPNQVLNLGIPTGQPGTGTAGPANSLSIGTVSTLTPGSAATASITGSAPNQTLSMGIPAGDKGDLGIGLSPSAPAAMTIALDTAYQSPTPAKSHFLSVMIDVSYSITVAASLTDTVELWVGTTSAVATGTGTKIASFRSALTGIAISIGMASGDRGQLCGMIPPNYYFAVRRVSGSRATIAEAFTQALT